MSSYDFEMYEKGVDAEELFDWTVFGALIRNKRKKKGYKTAEEFSQTIYNRTRFNISAETLYKIEGGKQVPNAMQLMAICMSVNWSPQIGDLFSVCASNEWNEVASGAVPESWRRQNSAHYSFDITGFSADISSGEWYDICHSDVCPERSEVLYCPEYETAFAEEIAAAEFKNY